MLKNLIAAGVSGCLLLGACTTLAPVGADAPDLGLSQVHAGDKVEVTLKSGARIPLTVLAANARRVTGSDAAGKTQTYGIDEILALKQEQIDAGRTSAAVVGGLGVAALLTLTGLFITAIIALSHL